MPVMINHRRHGKAEAARKAWLAQADRWPAEPWPCADGADGADGADDVATRRADSQTMGYTAHVPADDPRYRDAVAIPTMAAIDGMPAKYRAVLHQYGYVDVYRAWKRGWTVARIVERADRLGGRFEL